MDLKGKVTNRGFGLIEFKDIYGDGCEIQKSSLADADAIWFGIADADPQIMASKTKEGGTGWVPYKIPEDVFLTTRMHLSQEAVKELLPILQHFAETGDLPDLKELSKEE